MRPDRQRFRFVLAVSICASTLHAWPPSARPAAPPSSLQGASAPDLSIYRTLIDEANAAREAGDYPNARARVLEVVAYLLARPTAEQDAAWLALLDSAGHAAWDAQDAHTANRAWKQVFGTLSRTLPDEHPDLQVARVSLANTLAELGDLAGARALQEKVLEVRSRTLPDEHLDLQAARGNLANTLYTQGDLAGARALQEKVLEVFSRTLPEEQHDLQAARGNLANTLYTQGDLAGARALQEKRLEVASRTLPDEHPDLQAARGNLANTLYTQGDLAGARALYEKVLEVSSRTLPDEHPDLQAARGNLASTLSKQGDLSGGRALDEKVLEVLSRTLPDEHSDLQAARGNLASTLSKQGDLSGARALDEKVLEVLSRTLPDDHPDLQWARGNLANRLYTQGDLAGARALYEKVLEVRSRTLPDEHPDLQSARGNLANTLSKQGDLAGARALQEKALEVFSRTLPEEHHDLQAARFNLANTLDTQGDLPGARALEEKVLEISLRTLPDNHPDLQRARNNLANTLHTQGDLPGARALEEKVLEVFLRTLPDEHPDLQAARGNLARTIKTQGDLTGARALGEKVLEVFSCTLPDDHPDLQAARFDLALTIVEQLARANRPPGGEGERGGKERCAELIGALCQGQVRAAREAILASPGREAEERCSRLGTKLDGSLSFAEGFGVFEPLGELESASFNLSETTRGAAIVSAELARRAASVPKYEELRGALRRASDELSGLAQKGTTSEEFDRARTKRESVERELVTLARELSGGKQSGVELDVDSLAAQLDERAAAVGFRRFTKATLDVVDELDSMGWPAVRESAVDSLCAFVVRSSMYGAKRDPTSTLMFVDLGPIAPIEAAVRAWRDGLGVGSDSRGVAVGGRAESMMDVRAQGTSLRELIFDPLLPALAGAQHIVVALDDVLHLVPLDALSADEHGAELLGDRFHIETRATLSELMTQEPKLERDGALLGIGGISYGTEENQDSDDSASQPVAAALATNAAARSVETASILRGGAWSSGFNPLPATKDEVESITSSFTDAFGAASERHVLERSDASKESLLELAPKARYVHLATHGWFAPESIKSWSDPEPLDKLSGLGIRMSGEEQVKGMSPMLLCGLALAGANQPENAVGRVPGLITADELSTLDLSNCELVVLSACDTNVGVNRAGQGVASLQKALQMAGARSVITSLWRVPDEATKELMLDFYRRLWVEKKPKWQALWEAKMLIRNAKDESGALKYTTRDWAAWVLTGDPN